MEGYIKLNRMITEWQWYKDPNTARLFTHLLLMANHTTGTWRGQIILRGQFITSLNHLFIDTGLSIRNIRTALHHLKKTKDILIKTTNKYSLITICTYDEYIDCENSSDKQVTSNRHRSDTRVTTNNNDNNDENEKKTIYSAFYNQEIYESGNDPDYICAVKTLFGENNLGLPLESVIKMKTQLSFEQFQKLWYLKEKYKFSLTEILEEMENWVNLKSKKSVYLTFIAFIKRRNPNLRVA